MKNKKILRIILLVVLTVFLVILMRSQGLLTFNFEYHVDSTSEISIDNHCSNQARVITTNFYDECIADGHMPEFCEQYTNEVVSVDQHSECECNASSRGLTFHRVFERDLHVKRELTEAETDCNEWCSRLCEQESKEYFKHRIFGIKI